MRIFFFNVKCRKYKQLNWANLHHWDVVCTIHARVFKERDEKIGFRMVMVEWVDFNWRLDLMNMNGTWPNLENDLGLRTRMFRSKENENRILIQP